MVLSIWQQQHHSQLTVIELTVYINIYKGHVKADDKIMLIQIMSQCWFEKEVSSLYHNMLSHLHFQIDITTITTGETLTSSPPFNNVALKPGRYEEHVQLEQCV